jgi:hypothetical protein
VLLAGWALPGRADQTFWTVSTGPVPPPAPATAADPAGIGYYYDVSGYGSAGYGSHGRGRRDHRHSHRFNRRFENVPRRPHRVNPPGRGIFPQMP